MKRAPGPVVVACAALLAALTLSACVPVRREPPADEPRARASADSGTAATVVGYVRPDGSVVADTLAGARPDTARVERETVFAGAVAAEPERAEAASGDAAREAGAWRVQVYASREESSAAAFARRLEAEVGARARVERQGGWYRVRLGGYDTRDEAEALRRRLADRGYADAFVVRAGGER